MKAKVLAAAIAAGMAFGAQAEGLDLDTYVQFSYGQTKAKTELASSNYSYEYSDGFSAKYKTDLKDSGFKFVAGVELPPYLALEAQYIDFGEFSSKFTDSAYGGTEQEKSSIKTSGLGLNSVFTLPITDDSLFFAKGGAHYFWNKVKIRDYDSESFSVNGWSYSLGLGFLYDLSHNLSVVAEYERYFKVLGRNRNSYYTPKHDIEFLSLGLRYNF